MAVCQNLVPLVNIKIAGKWMFIPLKMVLIGIDPYPYGYQNDSKRCKVAMFPTRTSGGAQRSVVGHPSGNPSSTVRLAMLA